MQMSQEMGMELEEQDSATQQPNNVLEKTDKNCVKRVANNLLASQLFDKEKNELSTVDPKTNQRRAIQTKNQWNKISETTKNKMNKYALVSLLADVHSTKIRDPFSVQNLNSYNQLFGPQQKGQ